MSIRATLKSLREIAATPGCDPKVHAALADYERQVAAADAALEAAVREEEAAKAAIRARIAPSPAPGGPGMGGALGAALAANDPR